MIIYDISWPISPQMTEYKDIRTITMQPHNKVGSAARETMLTFKSHIGTHIDAPAHFIEDGKTIDQIPLTALIGECRVFDLMQVDEKITQHDLESYAIKPGEIILFKTKNSLLAPIAPFEYNFIYLAADAAHYLARIGVKAVGIDYLGIERNQPDHPTHKALLSKNIPIIEGLRLAAIEPGAYTLVCLPLACEGIDGAPARAVLFSVAEYPSSLLRG